MATPKKSASPVTRSQEELDKLYVVGFYPSSESKQDSCTVFLVGHTDKEAFSKKCNKALASEVSNEAGPWDDVPIEDFMDMCADVLVEEVGAVRLTAAEAAKTIVHMMPLRAGPRRRKRDF